MSKVIDRPQLLFLALAPIVLISGLINKGGTLVINIHDTYLVSDVWYIALYSTVFFLMIALNYQVISYAKKKPIRTFTIIHIALQLLSLLPLIYIFFTSTSEKSYDEEEQQNITLALSFLVFLLATVVHFINLILSLVRKKE